MPTIDHRASAPRPKIRKGGLIQQEVMKALEDCCGGAITIYYIKKGEEEESVIKDVLLHVDRFTALLLEENGSMPFMDRWKGISKIEGGNGIVYTNPEVNKLYANPIYLNNYIDAKEVDALREKSFGRL